MFYPLTFSLMISLSLTAKIPLSHSDSDRFTNSVGDVNTEEEGSSQDHFHEVVGGLDSFLDTLSNVTHSHDYVAANHTEVFIELNC